MYAQSTALVLSLFLCLRILSAQGLQPKPPELSLNGRKVTVHLPKRDARSVPVGVASVCFEALPERQCHNAPEGFDDNPSLSKIQIGRDQMAVLFTIQTVGTSGFTRYFALLDPTDSGKHVSSLFLSQMSFSNMEQHKFWTLPAISDSKIFLIADSVQGPNEAHYSSHRFVISVFALQKTDVLDDPMYFLEDQFLTVSKYDPGSKTDILAAEKHEILARLARIKASRKK